MEQGGLGPSGPPLNPKYATDRNITLIMAN